MNSLFQKYHTKDYLFHGSPHQDIKVLLPRQGHHVDRETDTLLPDGKPAVSATPYFEIAVFRALINNKNIPFSHSSQFGFSRENSSPGKMYFGVSSQKVLDAVQQATGYVYVFNRSDFEPYLRDGIAHENAMEWRSYKPVTPIDCITVTGKDLPPNNQIKIAGYTFKVSKETLKV